jgi:RNA polymerase sigma-70 factor, ECF subfamily
VGPLLPRADGRRVGNRGRRALIARPIGRLTAYSPQQAFVEAIRHRDRFDGRADVVTWLCAIGRNRLVDHFRSQGRDLRRQERLVSGTDPHAPDSTWDRLEVRDAVERALSQLPPDQRLALLFQHLDGLSVREIAQVIGRSEKATESLLSRARDGFRRAYGGQSDA